MSTIFHSPHLLVERAAFPLYPVEESETANGAAVEL